MKSYKNFINHLVLLISIILVSSCYKTNQHKIKSTTDWKDVSTWSFSGKLGISDGQKSGTGRINWQVTNNETMAQFKAPLGPSWSIAESANETILISSNNGESTAKNAQTLISNELGWDFPWYNLKYWLRGYRTNADLTNHKVAHEVLEDKGWVITYQKWMPTPVGLLPKKIKATKPPYSVKIIIYKWNIK